ncbi:hypothetical protein K440DRAFT_633710 [Wilcoxina mikolae CBS 423.85]|nr:hypothetical protein K440DRAFT_633710 [Wilcoxina mikolae CBS 423.85]
MANCHRRVSSGTDHKALTDPYTHQFGGNWGGSHLTGQTPPTYNNYSYQEPAGSDFQGAPIDPFDQWPYQPNNLDMEPEPQTQKSQNSTANEVYSPIEQKISLPTPVCQNIPAAVAGMEIVVANGPPTLLRCTFPSCTAKEEDKIFTGKGAKTQHKRHMDSHTKPYTCHHQNCRRYTEGFSRRDNLNIHLKSHRGSKGKKPRRMRSPEEVDGSVSGGDLRRIEKKRQRDMLKLMLKTTKKLLRQIEEEEEGDSTSEDSDDESEDEMAESSRNEGQ